MSRIRWYGPTLVLLMAVLLVMIGGPRLVQNIYYAHERATIKLTSETLEQSDLLVNMNEAFRAIAQRVQPSVVSIQTYDKHPGRNKRQRLLGKRYHWFFKSPFDNRDDGEDNDFEDDDDLDQFNRPREVGGGSGWVYDTKGHIITNYHVVRLGTDPDGRIAQKIEVEFHNGDKRLAKVVGTDPDTDVAVLKVEGDGLHPASLADQRVRQGDMVFAFGSPLGFDFSMSQGIVSAKNRKLGLIRSRSILGALLGYENYIQTDAAINRGNSGGPMTNIFGQVVAMNSAIATRDVFGQGFLGLGFAIPIDMVRDSVNQIIADGRVTRGWLGIEFRPLSKNQAASFGYTGKALLVNRVLEGPAEKAGLIRPDLILKFNGEAIVDGDRFRRAVARMRPGSKVELEIFRDGESKTIAVVLGEKPSKYSISRSPVGPDRGHDGDDSTLRIRKLGIEKVSTMSSDLAETFGLKFRAGVLIRKIRPNSIAAGEPGNGLKPGQIITAIQNTPIKSVQDLVKAFDEAKNGQVVNLSVVDRDGNEQFVFLDLLRTE